VRSAATERTLRSLTLTSRSPNRGSGTGYLVLDELDHPASRTTSRERVTPRRCPPARGGGATPSDHRGSGSAELASRSFELEDTVLTSPFLSISPTEWLASNELAFAIADAFPVSDGHTLIVPRRAVESWWEATRDERIALLDLAEEVKGLLEARLAPDGWNLGVNVGEAGGQTVPHLHLHLIPRYAGDVPDPRGGIRHAIPERGNWQEAANEGRAAYAVPEVRLFEGVRRPLGLELKRLLRDDTYDQLDIAVAFVTPSGVSYLNTALADGLDRGLRVRLLTSDYLDVTDPFALEQLLDLASSAAVGHLDLRSSRHGGSEASTRSRTCSGRARQRGRRVWSGAATSPAPR
jgi:diadenosine tetraphosphate (Ap4A) HIT family hydrolase